MPKKRRRRAPNACPCGSGERYAACCGPFHHGQAVPETAVRLMRSRYAAYARELVDYVVETTDPQGPAWEADVASWRAGIRRFARQMRFEGVDILDEETEGDVAWVRFRARLEDADGADASFVERSRFVRRDGRWLYSARENEAG